MVDSVTFDSTATNNHPIEDPSNVTVVAPGTQQVTQEPVEPSDTPVETGRPEKFKSDEEWRKHYDELQKKYTQDHMDPADKTDGDDTLEIKPEDIPIPNEAMEAFAVEYAEKGELSDKSYEDLNTNHGLDKRIVDQFIAGQTALRDQRDGSIKDSVGGEKAYKAMGEWARNNWTEAELNTYNEQINSPDVNVSMMAAKALKSDYAASEGTNPNLLKGGSNSQHGDKFESGAQVTAAMKDPRYATDPVYRREVAEKLDRSTFMGSVNK